MPISKASTVCVTSARQRNSGNSRSSLHGEVVRSAADMEAGDPSLSIDLPVRSLLAMGASNRDLAQLIG